MLKLSGLLILFIVVLFAACGSKGSENGGSENADDASCGENKLNTLTGNEYYELKDFKVKSVKSMKGGWMLNAKEKCRNVSIYLGNYDIEMGPYAAKTPQKEGEYLIQLCYNGDYVPKEESLKDVVTGDFVVGPGATNVGKPSVYVTIYDKSGMGRNVTDSESEGMGKFTMLTDKKVCGEIKVKGIKGFEIDASFVADIEKDTWANQK